MYDDGGLTLLLPYIISTRRTWNSCKLRVFALANKQLELEFEMSAMASLLAKFRIDYSDLQLISDITKKPQESTIRYFKEMVKEFMQASDEESNGLYKSNFTVSKSFDLSFFLSQKPYPKVIYLEFKIKPIAIFDFVNTF